MNLPSRQNAYHVADRKAARAGEPDRDALRRKTRMRDAEQVIGSLRKYLQCGIAVRRVFLHQHSAGQMDFVPAVHAKRNHRPSILG